MQRLQQHETRSFRLLVLLLGLCLAAFVSLFAVAALNGKKHTPVITERCIASVGGAEYSLTLEQARNASIISGVAVTRGLPPRAVSIALATAMQESGLRNLDYGDDAGPDSRGLFQQRPSQGWGSEEQVMDPVYAANAFYNGLEKVPGYLDLTITDAAQAVQRSAFPEAYAKHEGPARAFASALTGQTPAALSCTLRPPSVSADAGASASAVEEIYGPLNGSVLGPLYLADVEGTYGWSVAQWFVANAQLLGIESVAYDGRTWQLGSSVWEQSSADAGQVAVTAYSVPEE
ncbi:hypothetical protein LJ754_01390 [Arthrobacter sp. zg-Y40]|uniref:hypothetical protein n=1 Tax=unclassified Arthrobacter TaxID=235627 RepID=UPI001D15B2B7|nr:MULTISPECIES: hypothetical protein [unclassified Arthrobacter]MCC3276753.1 hypothetical protein [Arthrobacter sp. zg-Y20]MCC3277816.1 hypothetical protein [Arthrobacter sp. zg-Y40]MDK1316911.1 hypothetical protein [Arthrobacter sp. zg.Y20]WIB05371.1 hypothetical protein QNO06_12645 [Arthrobacter sp. zg-Y20]